MNPRFASLRAFLLTRRPGLVAVVTGVEVFIGGAVEAVRGYYIGYGRWHRTNEMINLWELALCILATDGCLLLLVLFSYILTVTKSVAIWLLWLQFTPLLAALRLCAATARHALVLAGIVVVLGVVIVRLR